MLFYLRATINILNFLQKILSLPIKKKSLNPADMLTYLVYRYVINLSQ